MIVFNDYPHGVSIVLKRPAKEIKDFNNLDFKKDVNGYFGYSHRGGALFTIGDRLFDEKYNPKEKDYTKSEWTKFMIDQVNSVKQKMKEGYTEEEAFNDTPISDVIPFKMRGRKTIETWEEAKQAAINMSKYLS